MKDRNHMSHTMQHGHHMGGRSQTLIADFTTGNVNKQLITFAMPMFLSHLLQIVYNMADMIIVGQTLGKVGLSAISIGGDIMNCMTFIAMGFFQRGAGADRPVYRRETARQVEPFRGHHGDDVVCLCGLRQRVGACLPP